jgi:hypothetical protein
VPPFSLLYTPEIHGKEMRGDLCGWQVALLSCEDKEKSFRIKLPVSWGEHI